VNAKRGNKVRAMEIGPALAATLAGELVEISVVAATLAGELVEISVVAATLAEVEISNKRGHGVVLAT
jgi:hypothetical protein